MSYLYGLFSKQVARYCADSSSPDCNKNLLISGVRSLANMDDNILDRLDPYQRGAKEMIWRAMIGSSRFSSRISHDNDESYFTTGADLSAGSGSETNGLAEETVVSSDYIAEPNEPYLTGPMVIRVYPDGRPVPEDKKRPLPRDEDVDELRYSRLPSVKEIEDKSGSTLYGKGTIESATRRPSFNVAVDRDRPLKARRLYGLGNPLFYDRAILRSAMNNRRVRYY
ncbi:Rhythmically expressed gene 5 protein [Ooceraea biroi]|nr:Rhythmically expressed gene 5 protein [Ooceraea biroi]